MRGRAVLLGAVLVAGCGASKSTSASSTPTTRGTTPPLTTTGQTTGTQTTGTLIKTTPTPAPPKTTATTTTGAINVRVPARFTVTAGGSVSPPVITIPAHLPVELVVVSTGGAHRITLEAPRPATLAVRAHGQAEALIDGLRVGRYPLKVDGAAKATLTIGGAPGP